MEKSLLKNILLDQRASFVRERQLIARDVEMKPYIKTRQVVVITGIRRCGKSSMMHLLWKEIDLQEEEWCYFNFDDERITVDHTLPEQIYQLHIELFGKDPVFFFDEIQYVDRWEKFVNRMYEAGFKFYLTGSNAKLLSSEISTSLTGRNKVLPLYPFSFKEYLRFKNKAYQTERLSTKNRHLLIRDLNAYLESGGFPLIVKENDTELLNGFFQDILYRDIISRYQLTQVGEIRQIALYFASNSGKTFSYATLQEMAGIKSSSSVKRYVDLYEQTYLFFYLKRYDVSLRKQLRHPKKVYAADTAIIHRLGFRFSEDKGRILENLVFLELLRRGHELYYYSGKKECDFLIKKGIHIQSAIQVCWSLNVENQEREKEGLLEAMQAYKLKEGLLITMDSSNFKSPNPSINVIPVWEWLLTVDR